MCRYTFGMATAAVFILCVSTNVRADDSTLNSSKAMDEARRLAELPPVPPPRGVVVDHSGRKEKGIASFYSERFNGKPMANGRRFNPRARSAASKSLPLGTIARVTNLENGRSTEVKVEDRGPYIHGRVVDLTPKAAEDIGITEQKGIAAVVVSPIAVPQPDGSIKPGAGAAEQVASSGGF